MKKVKVQHEKILNTTDSKEKDVFQIKENSKTTREKYERMKEEEVIRLAKGSCADNNEVVLIHSSEK